MRARMAACVLASQGGMTMTAACWMWILGALPGRRACMRPLVRAAHTPPCRLAPAPPSRRRLSVHLASGAHTGPRVLHSCTARVYLIYAFIHACAGSRVAQKRRPHDRDTAGPEHAKPAIGGSTVFLRRAGHGAGVKGASEGRSSGAASLSSRGKRKRTLISRHTRCCVLPREQTTCVGGSWPPWCKAGRGCCGICVWRWAGLPKCLC